MLDNIEDQNTKCLHDTLKWDNNNPEINKKRKHARTFQLTDRAIRKRKQKNRMMAEGSSKISDYFQISKEQSAEVRADEEEEEVEEADVLDISSAISKLSELLKPVANSRVVQTLHGHYDTFRYQAVLAYLKRIKDGKGAMEASQEAAAITWLSPSESYRAKSIRMWTKALLKTGISLS